MSLAFPSDFAQNLADATILMQHLTYWQHGFFPGKLPLCHAIVQDHIDGCAQIQAVVSGYVYEFVAVTTNDWRYAAVLRAEDIYRVRRMREGCQTLGGLQKLDAHWCGFRKKVEWPAIDSELHGGVPLHALLSRQAF